MCNLETNLRMLKIKHDLKYGTKQYLDVSEKTVFGINIGILGFGKAFLFLILSQILTKTNKAYYTQRIIH